MKDLAQISPTMMNDEDKPLEGELIKNLGGRPSLYTPDIPEKVYEMLKKGMHNVEICAALDISIRTFYYWKKEYPELQEAYERGLPHSQVMWEKIGEKMATGELQGNATVYLALMNNKFNGWAREPKEAVNNTTINIESLQVLQNIQQLTDDKLVERMKQLTEKLDLDGTET